MASPRSASLIAEVVAGGEIRLPRVAITARIHGLIAGLLGCTGHVSSVSSAPSGQPAHERRSRAQSAVRRACSSSTKLRRASTNMGSPSG